MAVAAIIKLYASTGEAESVETPVLVSSTPTGTLPGWSLTATSAQVAGSFTAGTWSGAWSSGEYVTAVSPTIGPAASLVIASGNNYRLWLKVVAGSETFIWPVATIQVP